MRSIVTIIYCVLSSTIAAAAGHYDYSANCSRAYREMLAMHFNEANRYLAAERIADPTNLLATYIANYEDCIILLINSDPTEYNRRAKNIEQRLTALESGDERSPWYRFCRAGIYLHKAIVNIRFGEQYKAAYNFQRSFALLKENNERFAKWGGNEVIGGLQNAVAGSLPPSYKWLASVFGIKGDIQTGAQTLSKYLKTHTAADPLYGEALLYNIYVRFYLLHQQADVWREVNAGLLPLTDNTLNTFAYTNLALDYRRADDALNALNDLSAGEATRYPLFYYQKGAALLTRCDTLSAAQFAAYITHTKSDLYIKDAWLKSGYAWHVNGNNTLAAYCMKQAGLHGKARIDADKQAMRLAGTGLLPNRAILQARLLTEGGYYTRAQQLLHDIDTSRLIAEDKVEYYFRTGRVYEELATEKAEHYKAALANYRQAIIAGVGSHGQFAARAALHMGLVCEKLGLSQEAIANYKKCLAMRAHDFQNSIDQQAKAGINRVEGSM